MTPTAFGDPCMVVAVRSGRSEQDICRLLLMLLETSKSSTLASQVDANGRTALMWATILQLSSVVKTFIDHFLNPIFEVVPALDDNAKLFRMQVCLREWRVLNVLRPSAAMSLISVFLVQMRSSPQYVYAAPVLAHC